MKCSAFWNHTNIRAGNRVYPCCRFKSQIQTFDGNLDTVLHSDEYENLRQQALSGTLIKGCEKCAYEESIGHKSLRQEMNDKYDMEKVELKFLEIGFDNLCNLVCDGCNSEFSTSWIVKEEELYGKAKNKLMEIDEITSVPSTVNKILFLGGEPLITKKHLQLCSLISNPESVELIYNTNGTFLPDDASCDVFDKFKNCKFILSIDGYKEVNETVRYGSKWQQILDFIEWCRNKKYDLEFNTVLHKNNAHDLKNLSNFIESQERSWYINVLTYPKHLDIINCTHEELSQLYQTVQCTDSIGNKEFIQSHIVGALHGARKL